MVLFFKKERFLPLSRRSFLAAAAATAIAPQSWQRTLSARVAALSGPGLLQSYDVSGTSDFDRTQANCAYVYDNAVVGLALLAAGDITAARRIGDALTFAQAHDRAWQDGRLRNAYRAGPIPAAGPYPLAGWWDDASRRWQEDAYQAGTATGVMAWAMLLWCALGPAYAAPAARAADFIEKRLTAPHGFAGGFFGFEPAPTAVKWVSTEHNIDLAAAFAGLGRTAAAAHAAAFVDAMWMPGERRFAMGLGPDGARNEASAVDANLWPLLARGAQPEWRAALNWVLVRHGMPPNAPAGAIDGVDFNTDRDGIWLEGTAYAALVCRRQGKPELAAKLMATLRGNTSPGGLIYATTTQSLTTGLATGLDLTKPDFLYYRRPHIGATAWAILAAQGATPFPT